MNYDYNKNFSVVSMKFMYFVKSSNGYTENIKHEKIKARIKQHTECDIQYIKIVPTVLLGTRVRNGLNTLSNTWLQGQCQTLPITTMQ